MTIGNILIAIDMATTYGSSFLGDISFDSVKDSQMVNNYLSKKKILNVYLVHFDESDNVKDDIYGGQAIGWYLISRRC